VGGAAALPGLVAGPGPAPLGPETARAGTGGARRTVFLHYTQAELDRAYDQFEWVDVSRAQVIGRYAATSAAVRERYAFTTHAYGDGEDERLDLFATRAPRAPLHVFVHGGSWRGLSKEGSAFPAPTFVENGAHFVALGFSNIPDARLPEMAEQVRRAVAWLHRNAGRLGGDPGRIHLSGHSSGAHLAALALTTDWRRYGVPPDVLKSGLLISGLYELHPVVLSARSAFLRLRPREVAALSPQRHIGRVRAPVTVAVGESESPEFIRQAYHFGAELERRSRRRTDFVVAEGLNHFDISFSLAYPDSVMGRVALEQMGLARG